MKNVSDLAEHSAQIISIVEKLEKHLLVSEERVKAIGPKQKELEEIEARILGVRDELEQVTKAIETAKGHHADFMSALK